MQNGGNEDGRDEDELNNIHTLRMNYYGVADMEFLFDRPYPQPDTPRTPPGAYHYDTITQHDENPILQGILPHACKSIATCKRMSTRTLSSTLFTMLNEQAFASSIAGRLSQHGHLCDHIWTSTMDATYGHRPMDITSRTHVCDSRINLQE